CIRNSKRLEQSKVVVDRVHVAHPMLDKFIVNARSDFRSHFDAKGKDSFLSPGEKYQKRGAIIPGKIDAIIEITPRNLHPGPCRTREEPIVDVRDRGKQFRALRRS